MYRKNFFVISLVLVIVLIIFIVDITLPWNYPKWLFYFFPILFVSQKVELRWMIILTSITSLVMIVACPLQPSRQLSEFSIVVHRVFGIAALWIVMFFIARLLRIMRKLQQTSALNNAILTQMTDGLVIAASNGDVLTINNTALYLYEFNSHNRLTKHISECFSPFKLYDIEKNSITYEQWPLVRALRGEKFTGVDIFVHRVDTGKTWYGSFSGTPIYNDSGELILALVTIRDITEQKFAELERERLLKDLQLHASQLQSANSELEAFSYSVSHDLRAPLTIISGFCLILTEKYGMELDDEGRTYLMLIQSTINKMQNLISDMMQLSRVANQEIIVEKVNLSEIVGDFLRQLHRIQPDRTAEFIVQKEVYVYADQRLIHLALENLLRNSWKFTAKKTVSRIEFGTIHSNNGTVYYIRDNGVGFDMRQAERLFRPFQRLHSQQEFKGTGIGLAIVQRVISRHGGRIWVEAETGKGATFYFTLC